jgi:hypothetical protein
MCSVQPALTLPRALVCSKRSGGKHIMRSFVSVETSSPFQPYCISLLTRRAVSTIYGVPIPQNPRRRHSAAQSDTPQLPDHRQSFCSHTYVCPSFAPSRPALMLSLPKSFRPNVLAGVAWQRTQHHSISGPEWYNCSDRSQASLPVLYSETGDTPSHKAIKGGVDGYSLTRTGPM